MYCAAYVPPLLIGESIYVGGEKFFDGQAALGCLDAELLVIRRGKLEIHAAGGFYVLEGLHKLVFALCRTGAAWAEVFEASHLLSYSFLHW